MGRKIDLATARMEAKNYLSLALALLDQAGATKAALHAATAIDYLDLPNAQGAADSDPQHATEPAEFSIAWGDLVSIANVDGVQLHAELPSHES